MNRAREEADDYPVKVENHLGRVRLRVQVRAGRVIRCKHGLRTCVCFGLDALRCRLRCEHSFFFCF